MAPHPGALYPLSSFEKPLCAREGSVGEGWASALGFAFSFPGCGLWMRHSWVSSVNY